MKIFKKVAGLVLLAVTFLFFIIYAKRNPQLWYELKNLNILIVIFILFLYFLIMGCLVLILKYTVEYFRKNISVVDNIEISSYSAIVNFFGPLQSGPGVRALYLKNKFKITIIEFFQVSILYYLAFAAISAICIVFGSKFWKWTGLLIPLIIGGIYLVYRWEKNKISKDVAKNKESKLISFNKNVAIKLFLITFVQIFIVTLIYFTELKTVNHLVTYRQAIAYTGVANLALFVSITPGAIGIREAFLLFSQRLIHISGKNIIAASIIDRAIYLLFLGIVFVFVGSLHVKKRLIINDSP